MTDLKALTDEQIMEIGREFALSSRWPSDFIDFARAIELATREQTASTGEPTAWLHECKEPDRLDVLVLLSRSPANPWDHWRKEHRDQCEFRSTPLYAAPVEQAGNPEPRCGLSWSGHNVWGDAESIQVVRAALHDAGTVPELKERIRQEQAGSTPDFDAWQANPYTKVLQKSIDEDYMPKGSTPDETLREALAERLRKMRGDYLGDGVNPGVRVSELLRALATPTKPEMQSVHPAVPPSGE